MQSHLCHISILSVGQEKIQLSLNRVKHKFTTVQLSSVTFLYHVHTNYDGKKSLPTSIETHTYTHFDSKSFWPVTMGFLKASICSVSEARNQAQEPNLCVSRFTEKRGY